MSTRRPSRLLAAGAALAVSGALAAAAAPAQTGVAAATRVTAAGVGQVKVGRKFGRLHKAGLVGRLRAGCNLAGPNQRSARLRAPLKGLVDFTRSTPRRARNIVVSGGATASGVGIGATKPDIVAAFPHAKFDTSTEDVFAITLVRIPKRDGGRLQFALDTRTKKVTAIGVPGLAFCE